MSIAALSASAIGFAINGRFFAQPVTGVQRYAREVVAALDGLLAAAGRKGTLVVPEGEDEIPPLQAIRVERTGPARGHIWEQAVLPSRWRGPLLNLCNTAPVVRARQIVCIHDANVFAMPDSYSRGFRVAYRTLQPLLARRSSCIATVSYDAARQLARHLPLKVDTVAVLPNGHEHALRWNRDAATVFKDTPQRRPFVLLLGSRARHKNVALILRLAEELDDLGLDLLVAGRVGAIFATERARTAPNVRWLGAVSDDDLALLFSKALCLAFPSLTEGFGLPIIEAMALGCPVVSSDRASMPEVCGTAALLLAPDDPRSWLAHIGALKGSEGLQEELRGRGRRRAAAYSWAATARGYLELIDGVLA